MAQPQMPFGRAVAERTTGHGTDTLLFLAAEPSQSRAADATIYRQIQVVDVKDSHSRALGPLRSCDSGVLAPGGMSKTPSAAGATVAQSSPGASATPTSR